jgi:Ca2+-binding RTX toxin-like protein
MGISDNPNLGLKEITEAEQGNIVFVSERNDFTHQTSFTVNTVGTEGVDNLQGTQDADKLTGGGSNDTLIAKEGSDYLDGGTGDDILIGTIANLPPITSGFAAWGDYDNDGLVDIVLPDNGVYRNNSDGSFTYVGTIANPPRNTNLQFLDYDKDNKTDDIVYDADYDQDGDLDRLVTVGRSDENKPNDIIVLNNTNGSLTPANNPIFNSQIASSDEDRIYGWEGDDKIWGSNGSDILDGGEGNDYISGGVGNDTIAGGVGSDTIKGGLGSDTVTYAKERSPVAVNLAVTKATTVAIAPFAQAATATPQIAVTASELVLQGTSTSLKLTLSLSKAATSIVSVNYGTVNGTATAGDDYTTLAGTLTFAVGQTTQTLLIPLLTDSNTSLTTETFTLNLNTPVNGTIARTDTVITLDRDTVIGIENLIATQFSDTVTGSSLDNILEGLAGNDTIKGGTGNDTIRGGMGNDILEGENGNDILEAGGGVDILKGGMGDDEYSFQSQWLSLEQAFVALGGDEKRLGKITRPTDGWGINWDTFQRWSFDAGYEEYQAFGLEVDLQREQEKQPWVRLSVRQWHTPEQAFTLLGGGNNQQNSITHPTTGVQIGWTEFNGWVTSQNWTKLAELDLAYRTHLGSF